MLFVSNIDSYKVERNHETSHLKALQCIYLSIVCLNTYIVYRIRLDIVQESDQN